MPQAQRRPGHLVIRTLPDLIICDVDMPYLNGYEFVAALKTHATTRDIPIVFLTSNEDMDGRTTRLLEVVSRFASRL